MRRMRRLVASSARKGPPQIREVGPAINRQSDIALFYPVYDVYAAFGPSGTFLGGSSRHPFVRKVARLSLIRRMNNVPIRCMVLPTAVR